MIDYEQKRLDAARIMKRAAWDLDGVIIRHGRGSAEHAAAELHHRQTVEAYYVAARAHQANCPVHRGINGPP